MPAISGARPARLLPLHAAEEQPNKMTGSGESPFSDLNLEEAIELRWTLRDIKARRWKLSPISPSQLEKLIVMGLVEIRNDEPVLTIPGLDVVA
jgi:hypothetical protein